MDSSPYSIVNVVTFLLLGASWSVIVTWDNRLLSKICNGNQFGSGSQNVFAFMDVMNNLKQHTSESPQLDYYCQHICKANSFMERDLTLFGHGVCTENLDPNDCHDCIGRSSKEMFKECTHSAGAMIKLMDCRLMYENYKFNNDC